MKPISDMTKSDLDGIKLISFDCDGVTIKKGTEIEKKGGITTTNTNQPTPTMTAKLNELKKYIHLTLNSGRSSLYLTDIYQELLWENISIISEIGLFILYRGQLIQNHQLTDYQLDTIRRIRLDINQLLSDPRVEGYEPKQFLTTLHCHQAVPEINDIVAKYDTQHEFYCWWNEEAYDINPIMLNKATGLQALCNLMNITMDNVMTVGNGINDHDMSAAAKVSITTDPVHLQADYFVEGEHLGGEKLADKLLSLIKST